MRSASARLSGSFSSLASVANEAATVAGTTIRSSSRGPKRAASAKLSDSFSSLKSPANGTANAARISGSFSSLASAANGAANAARSSLRSSARSLSPFKLKTKSAGDLVAEPQKGHVLEMDDLAAAFEEAAKKEAVERSKRQATGPAASPKKQGNYQKPPTKPSTFVPPWKPGTEADTASTFVLPRKPENAAEKSTTASTFIPPWAPGTEVDKPAAASTFVTPKFYG